MWKAGKFYDVGSVGGAFAHKILGKTVSVSPDITDKEILQQGLNGLFE